MPGGCLQTWRKLKCWKWNWAEYLTFQQQRSPARYPLPGTHPAQPRGHMTLLCMVTTTTTHCIPITTVRFSRKVCQVKWLHHMIVTGRRNISPWTGKGSDWGATEWAWPGGGLSTSYHHIYSSYHHIYTSFSSPGLSFKTARSIQVSELRTKMMFHCFDFNRQSILSPFL